MVRVWRIAGKQERSCLGSIPAETEREASEIQTKAHHTSVHAVRHARKVRNLLKLATLEKLLFFP